MNRLCQVREARSRVHRDADFADELSGDGRHDGRAQNLLFALGGIDDLDHALGGAVADGPIDLIHTHGRDGNRIVSEFGPRGGLGIPNGGNLGTRKGCCWNAVSEFSGIREREENVTGRYRPLVSCFFFLNKITKRIEQISNSISNAPSFNILHIK